jgi:aminoglycoside phosphotransferase family enzyme/predicted kinase
MERTAKGVSDVRPANFDAKFLEGNTWGSPNEAVEYIETHAAHVFLCGDRAFKIKKSVKLPYLDFSTVERRREVLAREFEINKLFAPDLYLHVAEKLGEPVLVMNRFPRTALLSWRVDHGEMNDTLARRLSLMMVESHRLAPRSDAAGSAIIEGLGAQLAEAFKFSPDIFPSSSTEEYISLHQAMVRRLASLLDRRGQQGLVRRCHGDAHCGNIIILDDRPILFDAIEFSEKIGTVDVLYDLAFLVMDLLRHDQHRAANIVLNHYLHLRRAEEDLSGLGAFSLFLATRAGVRALVTADLAHELQDPEAASHRAAALRHFEASLEFLKPVLPALVCIGGLSGSGKSTLAVNLAPTFGAPPGAIHVRSDIERKIIAGVEETERLEPEFYSPAFSARVYDAQLARAKAALMAGYSVIVDAVFARENERRSAEGLAGELGVEFCGIWLEAGADVLKSRVEARVGDASDATPEVVDMQLRYDLGDLSWCRVDASGDPAEVHDRAARLLHVSLASNVTS